MRALLNVDIARHLGIVLLKPGSELMPLFGAYRVLVEIPSASMKKIPSGRLPDAQQPLRDDMGLRPFFMKKAVITAAGGVSALESWLRRQVKTVSGHIPITITMSSSRFAIRRGNNRMLAL